MDQNSGHNHIIKAYVIGISKGRDGSSYDASEQQ